MDNIQIKRTNNNRRNMQSLLQQSLLDNPPIVSQHQLHQVRQVYTKTIKDLNQKIKQLQKYITKLQLQSKQKNQIINDITIQLKNSQNKCKQIQKQKDDIGKDNQVMRKRLGHLEYKMEVIQNNRKYVQDIDDKQELNQDNYNNNNNNQQGYRKEIYKQVSQTINKKTTKFISQLKKYPMNVQLQQSIQTFLQSLLYITPNQNKPMFPQPQHTPQKSSSTKNNNQNHRKIGRISNNLNLPAYDNTPYNNNITPSNASNKNVYKQKVNQLEQWKLMEKSLEKLKAVSPVSRNGYNNTGTNRRIGERSRYEYYRDKSSNKITVNYT